MRPRLTELSLVLRRPPPPGDVGIRAEWTIRRREAYPTPPGTFQRWARGESFESTTALTRDQWQARTEVTAAGWLHENLVPAGAKALLEECRRESQQPDCFSRLAVTCVASAAEFSAHGAMAPSALELVPWEEVFAREGLPVVRRARDLPRFPGPHSSRPKLAFPLRLRLISFTGGEVVPGLAQEPYLAQALGMGAMKIAAGEADDKDIDVLHVACIAAQELPRLVPDLSTRLRPRLLVVHLQDLDRVSPEDAWTVQAASGANSVLLVAGKAQARIFPELYRKLMHDWPLDRTVALVNERYGLPPGATILRSVEDGETCVSLSGVLDAHFARPVAQLNFRGITDTNFRGHTRGEGSSPLHRAWKAALDSAREGLASEVEHLTIDDEGRDLARALSLSQRMRVLAREGPAVDAVRSQVQAMPASHLAAAAARVTELWVTEGSGAEVPAGRALLVNEPYRLNLAVRRKARTEAWATALFPEQALKETFARMERVGLTVQLLCDDEVVRLDRKRIPLEVPRLGDSDHVTVNLRVPRPGRFSVRACLFHGTALLQSIVLEGTAASERGAAGELAGTLDYIASADLLTPETLPRPDVTIVTNRAADDSHWFAVFTGGDQGKLDVADGSFRALDSQTLGLVAADLQKALYQVQLRPVAVVKVGEKAEPTYRFEGDGPPSPVQLTERREQLVALARAGRAAHTNLFPLRRQRPLPETFGPAALVSIARCRPDHANVNWAALYDRDLDAARQDLALCQVFDDQLTSGNDLIDDPATCASQPHCPLKDPTQERRTVCPFGFWGFRHRIEQPPHHVAEPPAEDRVRRETMESVAQIRTSILRRDPKVRMGVAFWPHFPGVSKHVEALARLGDVVPRSDREEILELLRGSKHIYYFFCHGDGEKVTFKLRVGPGVTGDNIDVTTLDSPDFGWPATGPAPLVFLNGCDTNAFKADTINRLVVVLRGLGASAVIGTEIPVHSRLAEHVGHRVLEQLTRGLPLGDVFLQVRRELLRQRNPLGLAYAFYGNALLHLCPGQGCTVCRRSAPNGESPNGATRSG